MFPRLMSLHEVGQCQNFLVEGFHYTFINMKNAEEDWAEKTVIPLYPYLPTAGVVSNTWSN